MTFSSLRTTDYKCTGPDSSTAERKETYPLTRPLNCGGQTYPLTLHSNCGGHPQTQERLLLIVIVQLGDSLVSPWKTN